MNEPINDGGPAFPVMDTSQNAATGETTIHQFIHPGLTKRELFAVHCLPISRTTFPEGLDGGWDALCAHAFQMADSMLRASAEPRPEPEPKWPEFNVYAADPAQRNAMRTLQTRTWFDHLPTHIRIYVNDAVDAIARTEAGDDDIPF